MAANTDADVWESNRGKKEAPVDRMPATGTKTILEEKGVRRAMPKTVSPMLCTLTKDILVDEKNCLQDIKNAFRISARNAPLLCFN